MYLQEMIYSLYKWLDILFKRLTMNEITDQDIESNIKSSLIYDVNEENNHKFNEFHRLFKSVSCSALFPSKYEDHITNKTQSKPTTLFKPVRRSISYCDLQIYKNHTNHYNFFYLSCNNIAYNTSMMNSVPLPAFAQTETDFSLCSNKMIDSIVSKDEISNRSCLLEAGDFEINNEMQNRDKNKNLLSLDLSNNETVEEEQNADQSKNDSNISTLLTTYYDYIHENKCSDSMQRPNSKSYVSRELIIKAFNEFDQQLLTVKDQIEDIKKSIKEFNKQILNSEIEEQCLKEEEVVACENFAIADFTEIFSD